MHINKKIQLLPVIAHQIRYYLKKSRQAFKYYLSDISNYILVGALSGVLILWAIAWSGDLSWRALTGYQYGIAAMGGVCLGVSFKFIMIFAVEMVMRANAASASLNAKRAKTLGERLKKEAKIKVNAMVIQHAKDIIIQMHGEIETEKLESFFIHKMDAITEDAYFKIDRHLDYLTDRAVHGDIDSLKRLYKLYRRCAQERAQEIDSLLERIINPPTEVAKLKDTVDSLYDQWCFRQEARAYIGD